MNEQVDFINLTGHVHNICAEIAYYKWEDGKWLLGPRQPYFAITYDKEGKKISESHADIFTYEPSASEKCLTEYDDRGNTIEYSYLKDGILQYKKTFSYDNMNNLTDEVVYDSEGDIIHKLIYKYDSKGKMTEMNDYDSVGTLITSHKYNNKCDDKGNIVEQRVERLTKAEGKTIHEYLFIAYFNITYY